MDAISHGNEHGFAVGCRDKPGNDNEVKDRGEGASRFQRAEREFQTHLSGLGLRLFRNPRVFSPSFQKEGLREAPPRASKPILRSAKAREHAPPTTAAAP
jgi:hypothetical protein